jgi:hypothetical protein
MKNFILVLCVFVGAFWWCAAIINLFFCPSWFGLMGIWAGAAIFLLGMSEIKSVEV